MNFQKIKNRTFDCFWFGMYIILYGVVCQGGKYIFFLIQLRAVTIQRFSLSFRTNMRNLTENRSLQQSDGIPRKCGKASFFARNDSACLTLNETRELRHKRVRTVPGLIYPLPSLSNVSLTTSKYLSAESIFNLSLNV